MAHVFDGAPDARQAGDIVPSRFRPQYRALTDEEKALHDAIKAKAAEMEALFEQARALRYPPVDLSADADVVLQPHDPSQPVVPGAMMFCASIGPDWFDKGMDALELAVMWTVKGLTSAPPPAADEPPAEV